MQTSSVYEQKLNTIFEDILRMGVEVKEALIHAEQAMDEIDTNKAQAVILHDKEINESEMKLEDRLIQVIALDHPVASDLRRIVSAFKIIAHLERIGDHAVHTSRVTLKKDTLIPQDFVQRFDTMLNYITRMLDEVLKAFMKNDGELSKNAASYDDKVDQEYQEVLEMIYADKDNLDSKTIAQILLQARYLERAGDHITHICEWVYYASNGEHIEL